MGGLMYRTALSARRAMGSLAALICFAALAGCADDPSSPARTQSPNRIIVNGHPIIIIGGLPISLAAQLRSIGNPDIKLSTALLGDLQVQVYETREGFVLSWAAKLGDAECEAALSLGGAIYMIQDSEDFPNPETRALTYLVPPQTASACDDNLLEGRTGISKDLATRLVEDPEYFTAVFFLKTGGALAGTLQLGGPDTAPVR
jgi:hypothetical protein